MIFAWPLTLKNPCANMDPNLFFQKCKQQYWDKLNEVKAPWVLAGAASSKHMKSACRTAWTFIWPVILLCTGFKKMFRKLLKILNQQDPKFFLFVLLELWLVYHFPRFFAVFRRWRTKLMKRENYKKLKKLTFDFNLFLAPTRAHQVCICICFLSS